MARDTEMVVNSGDSAVKASHADARMEISVSADTLGVMAIVFSWAAGIALVNPFGDFPSVDDWAYAASVKALLERGHIYLSDWTAANLFSQVLWGTLFSLIFGLSYNVLRFSTLVLGLAGAIAFFRILRDSAFRLPVALLGTFIFLFNPMYWVLSFSFMTDVPYAAMQLVAMLLLLGGLRTGSARHLRLGWLTALAALLCRQVGLAIPLGVAAARLWQRGWSRANIISAVMPVAAFFAVQALYVTSLRLLGPLPRFFGRQIDSIISTLLSPSELVLGLLQFAVDSFYYFGVFLLPLSIIIVARYCQQLPRYRRNRLWVGVWIFTAVIGLFGPMMPVWLNNTIHRFSLGSDAFGAPPAVLFWPIVTFICAFGGVLLMIAFPVALSQIRRDAQARLPRALPQILAAAVAVALIGPIALLPSETRFDRYVIPVIPCIAIMLSAPLYGERMAAIPRPAIWASMLSLLALTSYSILGTHDSLAEKRVQWTALQDLVKEGISRENIDAGWVYNAPAFFGVYGDPNNLNTWFKSPDYVVVSLSEARTQLYQNYETVSTYPVSRWSPWWQVPVPIVVMRRPPTYAPRPPA